MSSDQRDDTDDEDPWRWRCRIGTCLTITQGGKQGLTEHAKTVHPGQQPDGTPF